MKKFILFIFTTLLSLVSFSQPQGSDMSVNMLKLKKDSTLRAMIHADSVKVEKQFEGQIKWSKLKSLMQFPLLNGGENSGVVPVNNQTEIPDPNIKYKLLFELTSKNPDSVASEINYGLTEVARVINLHVASGIPLKNIVPVIVVHAGALNAFTTNEYYKERYKIDNPNLNLINDLKNIGAEYIACGQAMAFLDMKKEVFLPLVKVSLTAKTVLSSYQLKGYVLFKD